MGNAKSSSASEVISPDNANENKEETSLAMMAVARDFPLERKQIIVLRDTMVCFSDALGMIKREGFDLALELANLSNVKILDLLFTMWDNKGEDKVSFKEFCIGISPLACPYDDIPTIIHFSLQVSDDLNRGSIEIKELHELLTGINSTASYFGDYHLLPEDIDTIVEVVLKERNAPNITHEDCITMLSTNPYVKRFASGKVRSQVQFKEDLVTEYMYDNINNSQPLSSIVNENNDFERGNLYDNNAVHNTEQHQHRTSFTNVVITSLLDQTELWESSTSTSTSCRGESAKVRDPPSRHSYSTYQHNIIAMDFLHKPGDPPTIMNE